MVAFGLNRLARALPDVSWLQAFRLPELQLSEEQKARRRRREHRLAGLEIIAAGLILPLLYIFSKVMLFDEPTTIGLVVVGVCSVLCFGVGGWIFVRNLYDRR